MAQEFLELRNEDDLWHCGNVLTN